MRLPTFVALVLVLSACTAPADEAEELLEYVEPQLVYGADDVRPIAFASDAIRARSAAVGIVFNDVSNGSGLERQSNGRTILRTTPLRQFHTLCAETDRRVGWWPLPARSLFGTGFLVAPNVIATNAHVADVGPANDHRVVFTWTADREGRSRLAYEHDEIYRTTKIIAKNVAHDWALLQLDRPVVIGGRAVAPLEVSSRPPRAGTRVTIVGHPMGTTKKFAVGAIRQVDGLPRWFGTDLDTYDGNSGSPIFDPDGVVVGVHFAAQGSSDFTKTAQGCEVLARCSADGSSCGGFAGEVPSSSFAPILRGIAGSRVRP